MSEKKGLKDWWNEQGSGVRLGIVGVSFIVVVVLLFILLKPAPKKRLPKNPEPPVSANMLLPKPKDRTVEMLAGDLTAQSKQLKDLGDQIKQERDARKQILGRLEDAIDKIKSAPGADGVSKDILSEVQKLSARLDSLEGKKELGAGYQPPNAPAPSLASGVPMAAATPTPEVKTIRIRVTENATPKPEEPRADSETPGEYVPMTTVFEGHLITGMDAPTDQSAKAKVNAVPGILRVKGISSMPNGHTSQSLNDCRVLVAGYGGLSDERAQLRTESIACIIPNDDPTKEPRVVEAPLDGFVLGEDGRVGVRGRLVSKQGQLIAKTLMAGVLSGFGDALKPTRVQGLDLNPSGSVQTQSVDASTIGKTGLATGLSDAAKSVSEYYLKLADQMMPVLEVDAGRKVTVALKKGFVLK
ncbi:TrbI/VirB10 family protein [Achromobacter xylosoxidans]